MNVELLYTIGVGNARSQISIYLMQLLLFMMSMDMTEPAQGTIVGVLLSSIIAAIALLVFQFYMSESTSKDGASRYIRNFVEKNKLFTQIMLFSYGFSLVLLIIMYALGLGVAPYFKYTGPGSLLVLLLVMTVHELSTNAKYNQLKNASWVFDYKRVPTIKTTSAKNNVSINMFNDKNHFVADESIHFMELDDVFNEIPPGTKMNGGTMKKPNYKDIPFDFYFKYNSTQGFKHVYLKQENNDDDKLFDLYLDILSRYKGLYSVEHAFIPSIKTTININKKKIEKYIEKNDYIRKYVTFKDVEVGLISVRLALKFARLPYDEFVKTLAKPVLDYEIRKEGKRLYINDPSFEAKGDIDVSYLLQYMSMNLEEYKPKEKEKLIISSDHKYATFKEKLDEIHVVKEPEPTAEDEHRKSLYRMNIKGQLVYLFLEDFKSVSEIDEIIFTRFINKDIEDIVKRMGFDKLDENRT